MPNNEEAKFSEQKFKKIMRAILEPLQDLFWSLGNPKTLDETLTLTGPQKSVSASLRHTVEIKGQMFKYSNTYPRDMKWKPAITIKWNGHLGQRDSVFKIKDDGSHNKGIVKRIREYIEKKDEWEAKRKAQERIKKKQDVVLRARFIDACASLDYPNEPEPHQDGFRLGDYAQNIKARHHVDNDPSIDLKVTLREDKNEAESKAKEEKIAALAKFLSMGSGFTNITVHMSVDIEDLDEALKEAIKVFR